MIESIQISYIEENFDIQHAGSYSLLIRIGQFHSDLAIVDEQNRLQLLLSWLEITPDERVKQLLELNFKAKRLVFDNTGLLLIPDGLYSSGQEDYFYHQLQLDKSLNKLVINHLGALNIQSVCSLPEADFVTIREAYPGVELWSKADVLIATLPRILMNESTDFLHIHMGSGYSDFTYFRNRQLQYHQSHTTANADDFNYFLLNIAEQLDIKLEGIPVWLSGKINGGHPFLGRLKKYNSNFQFVSPSLLIKGGPSALEKDYDLLTLIGLLCVS